jgi:hypothetical protein
MSNCVQCPKEANETWMGEPVCQDCYDSLIESAIADYKNVAEAEQLANSRGRRE